MEGGTRIIVKFLAWATRRIQVPFPSEEIQGGDMGLKNLSQLGFH